MRKFRKSSLFIVTIIVAVYFAGRAWYFKPEFGSGEQVSEFRATLADGRPFSLSQMRGSYVLIDFWGSWCGPCIREIPAHNELFREFHNSDFRDGSGFEIVSIAVEESEARWRNALARYKPASEYQILDQVTSLRFFNGPLTNQLSVKKLPASFLIDPSGNLLGMDLKTDEIRAILQERLKAQ